MRLVVLLFPAAFVAAVIGYAIGGSLHEAATLLARVAR